MCSNLIIESILLGLICYAQWTGYPSNLASPKAAPESTQWMQTDWVFPDQRMYHDELWWDSQEWSHEVCLLMNIYLSGAWQTAVCGRPIISCSTSTWIPFWLEVGGASPPPPQGFSTLELCPCVAFSLVIMTIVPVVIDYQARVPSSGVCKLTVDIEN